MHDLSVRLVLQTSVRRVSWRLVLDRGASDFLSQDTSSLIVLEFLRWILHWRLEASLHVCCLGIGTLAQDPALLAEGSTVDRVDFGCSFRTAHLVGSWVHVHLV